MASTPTPTTPADNAEVNTPFDQQGTNATANAFVELRGENGLLVPATANPVVATGPGFVIPGIISLVGDHGAAYANAIGTVSVPAAGPGVVGAASARNAAIGNACTVTFPATIPAGALVLLFGTIPGYIGTDGSGSASGLTFTQRRRFPDSNGGGTIEILSAVAATEIAAGLAVTYTSGNAAADRAVAAAALVLTSANTSTFAYQNVTSAGVSADPSHALAATAANSLILGVLKASPGTATSVSLAPSAGTTELTEQPSNGDAAGELRSAIWLGRADGAISAPSTGTIAGTWSSAAGYAGILMEVRAA